MSIRARIEDGVMLSNAGRHEGAVLSFLIAIAATSRKRFPKSTPSAWKPRATMGDREAFVTFFAKAFADTSPIKLVGGVSISHDGKQLKLEELFYEFMRCSLVHEAGLAPTLRLVCEDKPGMRSIRTDGTVDVSCLGQLLDMVVHAPENAGEFADISNAATT